MDNQETFQRSQGNAGGKEQAIYSVQEDLRVYVCGVDVSRWVSTFSPRISPLHMGGNSCTITLQNPNNLFTILKENIQGTFHLSPQKTSSLIDYDETVKKTIYMSKKHLQDSRVGSGRTMRQIVEDAIKTTKAKGHAFTNEALFYVFPDAQSPEWQDKRWDLSMGTPVFNVGDPIRAYARHPTKFLSRPDGSVTPAWYAAFTGYLSNVTEMGDLGSGVGTIALSAEGAASRLLRLSRVNRNITTYLDLLDQQPDLIMGDIILTKGLTSMFTDLSMVQLLGVLVVGGRTDLNKWGPKALDETTAKILGIGRYTLGSGNGGIQEYREGFLETWQHAIHPQMTLEDVVAHGSTSGFGPDADVQKSANGFSGATAPDTGHLHMLLPPKAMDAGGISHFNRIVEIATTDIPWQSEVESRLDIVKKYLCEQLYYSVLELPNGDLAAEFPQFDFTPYDLGTYGKKSLIHNSAATQLNITEDDSKAYTWIVLTGSLAQQVEGNQVIKQFTRTAHGILSTLIPRFGIRVLPLNNPLLRSTPALQYFLRVACARMLADIRTANAPIGIYDPELLPNRPYLLANKGILGLISSISNSLTYQGSAGSSIDMQFLRQITRNSQNELEYMLIGGEASKPLQYKVISKWDQNTTNFERYVSVPEKPDKTATDGNTPKSSDTKEKTSDGPQPLTEEQIQEINRQAYPRYGGAGKPMI